MFIQSLRKEIKLISLDAHSVAVLLIMPVLFMLIMTFAASGNKEEVLGGLSFQLPMEPLDSQPKKLFVDYLKRQGVQLTEQQTADVRLKFTEQFDALLSNSQSQKLAAVYAESISPQSKAILDQQLEMAFAKVKLHLFLLDSEYMDAEMPWQQQLETVEKQTNSQGQIKTSGISNHAEITEYSIPSWIIFGVYFIVLPISITLLNEERNGTLIRLKTFPVPLSRFFLIKIGSYYLISLVQFIILALIGLLLVPRLVGLPSYSTVLFVQLLPVILLTSLAAVSFAAVIATQVKTYEQAIVIGGGINIILAALSGFMVPLDIMPKVMQDIAHYSPMQWSAALVKAAMRQELHQSANLLLLSLLLFSALSLILALILFRRKTRNLLWN